VGIIGNGINQFPLETEAQYNCQLAPLDHGGLTIGTQYQTLAFECESFDSWRTWRSRIALSQAAQKEKGPMENMRGGFFFLISGSGRDQPLPAPPGPQLLPLRLQDHQKPDCKRSASAISGLQNTQKPDKPRKPGCAESDREPDAIFPADNCPNKQQKRR